MPTIPWNTHIIAGLLTLAASTAAQSAQPYEGKWVSHQAHCNVDIGGMARDGTVADGTIIIRGKSLREYEGSCRVKSVRQSGEAWLISTTCDSEGEITNDVMKMKVEGDVATIEGRGSRLRCSR